MQLSDSIMRHGDLFGVREYYFQEFNGEMNDGDDYDEVK